MARNLFETLQSNDYPGRGILMGRTEKDAVLAYFIMGRSENSRNRIFVKTPEGIRTQAFDPGKLTDPSLILYAPVRVLGDGIIVTNGDQTDTIWEFLRAGKTFEEALRTRTFEPDAPNYTPRISGLMRVREGGADYRLSILKSAGGNPASPQRFFFEYLAPAAGEGHLIHTYLHDGSPIPSFEGEPACVGLTEEDIDSFSNRLWDSLNPLNRVSLYVRFTPLSGGTAQERILNKNEK